MADAQQNIISAFTTKLKTISVANGYSSALGAQTSLWEQAPKPPISQSEFPSANIRDPVVEVRSTDEAEEEALFQMTVELDIACAAGTTSDTTMRSLFGDVYRAIGLWAWGSDATIKDNMKDIQRVRHEIFSDEQEKIIVGGKITLMILYSAAQFPTT